MSRQNPAPDIQSEYYVEAIDGEPGLVLLSDTGGDKETMVITFDYTLLTEWTVSTSWRLGVLTLVTECPVVARQLFL
ncbi:hypothetical protein EB796_008104 [Bugula neritina]|uniref:Uncharacterized protein n=1 Tax=Bugula neritina TaxID=10212 RepID=A0A7J7K6N5_BUGNE|nr:hypothetical protein EB796_008104 [Bugula neritina]